MSVRPLTRTFQCNLDYLLNHRPFNNARRPSWCQLGLPRLARGVKRTTIIKASSLASSILSTGLGSQKAQLLLRNDDKKEDDGLPFVLSQHLENTRKFKDCIVLTEVGDFYEMYFDQVEQYAPLVNLKVAKRSTKSPVYGEVPMAGFKRAQLEKYLKMFVQDLGKQVVLSEQRRRSDVEKAASTDGLDFERRITRVITAGTLIDESFMDHFENNYVLAIHFSGALPAIPPNGADRSAYERYRRKTKVGLSWVDVSSGDFYTQCSDLATLPSLVARIGPREIVVDASLESANKSQLQRSISDGNFFLHFHQLRNDFSEIATWASMLERPVSEELQANMSALEVAAGGLVLDYVQEKLPDANLQLQPPVRRIDEESMVIDKQTLRNLEIRSTLRDSAFQGSLLHVLRQTATKSGARLLGRRLVSPSMSLSMINNRLDLVQEMLTHERLRQAILDLLKPTWDTYRLLQKFSIGKGDADDLVGLSGTIEAMQELADLLHDHIISQQDKVIERSEAMSIADLSFLWDILGRLDLETPLKVARNIQTAIDEDGLKQQHQVEAEMESEAEQMTDEVITADINGLKPPKLSRRTAKAAVPQGNNSMDSRTDDIWIMRRKASPVLERAHNDLDELLLAKQELATRLRRELQTESLTLKWSASLGHYCHVKGKDAQRSITALGGARRIGSTKSTQSFSLQAWTDLGGDIEDIRLRIRTEEELVFGKLRGQVLENIVRLRRNAAVLDELDVACSSAVVAKRKNLVRPLLNDSTSHKIVGGRHPTVDVGLKDQGRSFTSNDCAVGDQEQIYLITGPNMGGKSTYLRQNALITILAQTGCFVPAEHAEVGLVDKIFSRVGSADNLYQDQSTFMVEMLETAEILKQATPRSFVIMDEVGRGTTPEDGTAVGYACLYHLHTVNRCRSLFATHFHALADMTRDFDGMAYYCTDVVELDDGSWMYDHRLRKGVNRDSHALKVARLAGMPESAIDVAAEVLLDLQKRKLEQERE